MTTTPATRSILNWRVILIGLAPWLIIAAVVAIVWWLS